MGRDRDVNGIIIVLKKSTIGRFISTMRIMEIVSSRSAKRLGAVLDPISFLKDK